jgi:uncharacterized membrane protein HdeD (DUF308 family)
MTAEQQSGSFLPGRATAPEALRRSWLLFALLGGALVVLGAMAVGASFIATLTTVIVFGSLLMVAGALEVVNSFWARAWRGFILHLLAGVLYVIVGLLMIEHPLDAAVGLTLMVAAALLVGGLIRIAVSAVDRFHGWVWSLCSGVVSVLLGVLIWRQWPASGLWVIGLFVGVELMINGWTWVMLALALKGLIPGQGPAAPGAGEGARQPVGHA